MRLLSAILLLLLVACSRTQPVNPVTGGNLVDNSEELTHEQRITLQAEMIHRQQLEKERQKQEYLRLKRQEKYNQLTERFKD